MKNYTTITTTTPKKKTTTLAAPLKEGTEKGKKKKCFAVKF